MSLLLREKLNSYSIKEIKEIASNVGIKNCNTLTKNEIIETLTVFFETLEEFESIIRNDSSNEKLLSNYSVPELRKIYNYCFSNITARDIRSLRKEKLIQDLSNISDIENIINEYKKNVLKKKEKLKKQESNPIITYLNKLKKNHRRLLCKNLNIKNYVNMKKDEIFENICEIIEVNDYDIEDIDNILKGIHKTVKTINHSKKIKILSDSGDKIKYIVHISDLHIRRNDRIIEYRQVFENFYKSLLCDYEEMKGKTLVVCCGDIFHYKTTQRAEGLCLWNFFVKKISSLHPFLCILGNHDVDLTTNNIDWIKPLDGIVDDFYYLNTTGRYKFNNIEFGVSSLLTGDILQMNKENDDTTYIQLYHGAITGHTIFNNQKIDTPYKVEDFGFFDYMLLGDIHKYQFLDKEKRVCYSGSMIQQNKGESIYKHGYVLWDLEKKVSYFNEVQNDYCFLKVEIENNKITYDENILNNKKYLNLTYVLKDESKETEELIEDFKNKLEINNIKIIKYDYDRNYDEKEDIKNMFIDEVKKDKKIEDYISSKLNDDKMDNEKIKNILDIHSQFLKDDDNEETIFSKWFLKELSFKNIFSYGNNIENKISFDTSGFYKIFGQNYLGKSSILNMIKWLFYGEDSGINDCDILHKSKTSLNEGYIRGIFRIGNYNYHINKDLIKSSKKCGFDNNCKLIIFEDTKQIDEIFGFENVNTYIKKLIGDYKQFEIIASINNTDIGILKEKKILTIFNKLFKLDKFETYEEKTKEKIKELNTEVRSLMRIKNNYNENYNTKLNKITLDIKRVEKLLSTFVISEFEKDIEKCQKKLESEKKKLSKIILKEENECEDKSSEIKETEEELEQLKNNYKDSYDIQTNLTKLESKYEEYNDKIKNLNKQLRDIDDIDVDELKTELINENKNKTKLLLEIKELIDEVETLKKVNNEIIYKIVNLSMDEDEILENIKKQGYNYKEEKDKILTKLKSKKKIVQEDKNLIIKLLMDQDYHSLLETLKNNETYEEKVEENNLEIKKLEKKIKIKNNKLLDCKHNIQYLENDLQEEEKNDELRENNKKILIEIEKNEKIIKEIKKDIHILKKEYNESVFIKEEISELQNNLNILNMEQKQYEKYIEAMNYNKKYKQKYNDISLEIMNLNVSLDNFKKKDMNVKFEKKNHEIELKNLKKDLSIYEEKKNEIMKINNELIKKNIELSNLKIYKSLINEKGIPSLILEDKMPNIEVEINKILSYYTNFQIKIEINGNGSRKKIDIYQIKNKKKDMKLTVNSCSGYELFILNIAFKIVIKNSCYINCPSFICIDEVWEKISEENYNKLHKIFDLLKNNYKNILVISHIDQIKNYLEENYSGKHINIIKDMSDNYSFLGE